MSSTTAATQNNSAKKIGKAVLEALKAGAPNVDLTRLPNLTDMSPKNITENVIAINSLCENPRQKFVFEKIVKHLHDFAREVGLTTEEWMLGVEFLTATGQISNDKRTEFILLSDILGLSCLVDSMNHPVVPPATEGTVLGPFHTDDPLVIKPGESIASEGKGEFMWCEGYIRGLDGKPLAGVVIESWETDDDGLYDVQYEGRTEADCRGRLVSDENGYYCYRAILPTPYPIPHDGPVGKLLKTFGRHVFRPAHLHMMFHREGIEKLVTSLYFKGDPYLQSDAVFGVKSSLIVDPQLVTDKEKAKALGFSHGPYWHLQKDYVLLTVEQAEEQKRKSLANYYDSLQ